LAVASPQLAAYNARLFILGRGFQASARRMANTLGIAPDLVLYDERGEVYDRYMLDRVFLSLIQRSALFVIDREGIIQHAYVVANPQNWLGGAAFDDLMRTLDAINRPE
jgi:hypothetical protein